MLPATTGEEGGSSNLVRKVEQLAGAHRAYAQLFEVCRLQDNDPKLHGYMMRHRIMLQGNQLDLEQSAVAYVFDRLATSCCNSCCLAAFIACYLPCAVSQHGTRTASYLCPALSTLS